MSANYKYFIFGILAPALIFSCKSDPKQASGNQKPRIDTIRVANVPKEGAVKFEVTKGTVHWTGKKAFGDTQTGTVTVEKGELMVNRNQVTGGSITLDMSTITVTNIQDSGERKDLESHLKDTDFFEVEKYPKAEFKIEQVLPMSNPSFNWLIVGNLKMKSKTNPVNIPVQLRLEGDRLSATTPTFPINRTQWGVNFRSSLLGTAKDKLIEDTVLLSLELEAQKAE